jgi:hypothetical protein
VGEKDFKKHLRDLAHRHHHPEEYDWEPGDSSVPKVQQPAKATRGTPAKGSTRKPKAPGEKAIATRWTNERFG